MVKRKTGSKRRWFVAESKGQWIMDGTSQRGYGNKQIARQAMRSADETNRDAGRFIPATLVYGYAVDA